MTVGKDILVKSLLSVFEQYYPEQEFDCSRTGFNYREQKVVGLVELLESVVKEED